MHLYIRSSINVRVGNMNEETKPSLADFYKICNNLQYIRIKARLAMQAEEQFKVRGAAHQIFHIYSFS